MTAAAVPGGGSRSLISLAVSRAGRSQKTRRRAAAIAAGAREHVITLTALGCADWAAFIHSRFAGLLILAACLLVAEWKIQG